VKGLSSRHRVQIRKKIELIKENPFRFKRVHSKKFSRVFRVRLNIEGREIRLIYVVMGSRILHVCLLDRRKGYADLEHYLSKLGVDSS
jgi:mRNA-degrading endonuclease RelE of RelBE toxin-antitoxin system